MRRLLFLLPLSVLFACVGPEDAPSNVYDLRVLGVQTSPPELMAPECVFDFNDPKAQQMLAGYAQPIDVTTLIQDPAGEGRDLSFELWACASVRDRTCDTEQDRYLLDRGTTKAGELKLTVNPALSGVDLAKGDFSNALLLKVQQQDTYKGLGGIRVPLVLHLKAGDEEIYAQKLMVYSCNFFPKSDTYDGPTMTQNVLPELPGVTAEDKPWAEDEVRVFSGAGPFVMEPPDFKERQEHYVVPSFELKPVELDESWKIAWHADLGRFSPNQTGGAAVGGGDARHRAEWSPGSGAKEQDVHFWFVVRDGRGGTSWLTRTAHYKP